MTSEELLGFAQRIQALAQAGLAYATNAYDAERFQELRGLSVQMLAGISDEPLEKIARLFASETGYQTPKVDVRAVVFDGDGRLLLVRETADGGRWTMPGGWADVGYTPFEVAEKETAEETGLTVRALRLLALLDKRKHQHPAQPWYVYKAFVRCEVTEGELLQRTAETGGAGWFAREQVRGMELSTDRVTREQMETMFRFATEPELPAMCD